MIASAETTIPENFTFSVSPVWELLSHKEFVKTMEIVKTRSLLRK